jgi:hypothetical protein
MPIVEQYGMGFVVLRAGAPAVEYLTDILFTIILLAVEAETRRQAQKYTGTFTSLQNTVTVQTSFSIDDSPGLRPSSLVRIESDIIAGIQEIWTYTALSIIGNPLSMDNVRLYPTRIYNMTTITPPGSNNWRTVYLEDWPMNFELLSNQITSLGLLKSGILDDFCKTWQTSDWIYREENRLIGLCLCLMRRKRSF